MTLHFIPTLFVASYDHALGIRRRPHRSDVLRLARADYRDRRRLPGWTTATPSASAVDIYEGRQP